MTTLQIISFRQDSDAFIARPPHGRRGWACIRKAAGTSLRTTGHTLIQATDLNAALASRLELERQDPYVKMPRALVEGVSAQRLRASLSGRENIIYTAILASAFDTASDAVEIRLRDITPFISGYRPGTRIRGLRGIIERIVDTATACGLPLFRISEASRHSIKLHKCLAFYGILDGCRHYSRIRLASASQIQSTYAQRLFWRTAYRADYGDDFIRPLELSTAALRRTLGCTDSHARNNDFLRRVVEPAVEEISELAETFFLRPRALYDRKPGQRGRAAISGVRFEIEKLSEEREDIKNLRARITKWSDADKGRCRLLLTDFRKLWEAGYLPHEIINTIMPSNKSLIDLMPVLADHGISERELLSAYTLVLQHAYGARRGVRMPAPGAPTPDDLLGRDLIASIARDGSAAAFTDWAATALRTGWIDTLMHETPKKLFDAAPAKFVHGSKMIGFEKNNIRMAQEMMAA